MINVESILESIQRVASRFVALEKKPALQLGDISLHASEIHLMLVIANDTTINVSGMAEKLGITKGAVSQTLSRLERKRILIRSSVPDNNLERNARFTPRGVQALSRFHAHNDEQWRDFAAFIEGLPDHERDTVKTFLTRLEVFLRGLA